jgi:hypothetical protein
VAFPRIYLNGRHYTINKLQPSINMKGIPGDMQEDKTIVLVLMK